MVIFSFSEISQIISSLENNNSFSLGTSVQQSCLREGLPFLEK